MFDYLKAHAAANVWCSPEQDNQVIVAAKRITKLVGELISFPLMGRRVGLPTTDRRYHVFQIGQAHPALLGLLPRNPIWSQAGWVKFSDTVNKLPLFADLYTDKGVHLPLHRCYYQYSNDYALVFAVPADVQIGINYSQDQVYLRLYTNAYYDSSDAQLLPTRTYTEGKTLINISDILQLQTRVTAFRALTGVTLCFVNGQLVEDLSPLTAKLGDIAEFIYDGSIKRVVDLPVSDMRTFTSSLDSAYKYLLHYPDTHDDVIDYVDDIDVYVVYRDGTRTLGRYYHRNLKKSLRNVTHRDYSLPVDLYENTAQALVDANFTEPQDLRSLSIRLYIRHSGLRRPLIKDNNRLFELYKLKDEDVVGAMVGVDATNPYWQADTLESSGYTTLMRSALKAIDIDLVERCYGYNSMTQILADSPLRPKPWGQSKYVPLGAELQQGATFYEYDDQGLLLGSYVFAGGQNYYPTHAETALVEGFVGQASRALDTQVGTDNLLIPTQYSYRVYMCYLVDGVPNHDWKDITDSAYYTVEGGLLKWSGLETDQWLMIRSDARFLGYQLSLTPSQGVLSFDLTEEIQGQTQVMRVPLGDLDLWLNRRSLIRDLDYVVDFPKVVIFNKVFLEQPVLSTPQQIEVRFSGFPNADLSLQVIKDYGFVEHGVLSNNNRFDVRDDKVLRITVKGQVRHRSDVIFSETHLGVSITDALNGSPYQIKDVVVPLRTWSASETYALKAKALLIDQATEDYMSRKLPQPPREALSAIPQRYVLFSPFFAKLVTDLALGHFDLTALQANLTDNQVMALVKPYEPLLENDPLNPRLHMDPRYVVIHPTSVNDTVNLDLYRYRFLQKVVKLYGRNQIAMTPYLNVSLGA